MEAEAHKLDRRDFLLALAVVLLALGLRLVYLSEIESIPFLRYPLIDAQSYDDWARRIAAGDWWGDAVFYQAPAYPYFLAVIYTIVGPDLGAAHVVQSVMGAISCGLMMLAARLFFDRASGLAAGLILALYAPAIFFDAVIQKAGLGLFIVSGFLLGLAAFQRRPSLPLAAACGAILGLLALTRENALIFVGAIPFWIAIRFQAESRASRASLVVLFLGGVATILIPIAMRNYAVGDSFALTTAQLGPNFYIGNHSGAIGVYEPLIPGRETPEFEGPDARRLAEQRLGRRLTSGEVSDYWRGQGLAFIREEPLEWASLLAAKTIMMFNAFEIPDTEDIHAYADESRLLRLLFTVSHFGVLFPLAVVGMFLAWPRQRDVWIHYLLIAVFSAATICFYVMARYRYPVVPLLIPLAGFALVESGRLIKRGKGARLAAPAIVAAMVALFCNRTVVDEETFGATAYGNLGFIMLKEGELERADAYFARAQGLAGDDPGIQFQVAALRYQQDRLEDAKALLRQSIATQGIDYRPHLLLAKILRDQGHLLESRVHQREGARLKPDQKGRPGS